MSIRKLRLTVEPSEIPVRRSDVGRSAAGRGTSGGEPLAAAHWLGQAGFLLEAAGLRILIDPYLSDSLEAKYRGSATPHDRLAPPPISVAKLTEIDFYCATHAHSDHLDPGTIPAIAAANPGCLFIVPASARVTALERGVPSDRLVSIDAGETVTLCQGASLVALPSAHETRERDDAGHEKYLGYAFRFPSSVVYHSGDCVPFDGLVDLLRDLDIDLALLPVNGRDAERATKGIAGNFTLDEALELVEGAGIGAAVLHHFGMFAFNTIDPQEAEAELERVGWPQSRASLAKIGVRYALR